MDRPCPVWRLPHAGCRTLGDPEASAGPWWEGHCSQPAGCRARFHFYCGSTYGQGFFLVWLAAWSGMSWSWCQLAGGWSHILGQLTDRPRLSGWSWVPTWQAAGSRGPCIWCLPTTNQGQIPGLGLAQCRAKLGPRVSDCKAVGGSQSWWWPTGRQVWVPGPAVEWVCVPAELASCREPSQNCSWQAGGGGGQDQSCGWGATGRIPKWHSPVLVASL